MAECARETLLPFCKRALFEAEKGCLEISLLRLTHWIEKCPDAADLWQTLAFFHLNHTGKGLVAKSAFEKAHEIDPDDTDSMGCLMELSITEREWIEWEKKLLKSRNPNILNKSAIQETKDLLKENKPFVEILCARAQALYEMKNYGRAACLYEIAIESGDLDDEELADIREFRARTLRELDRVHMTPYKRIAPVNPPENRIPLTEALKEWDLYLEEKPAQKEAWNAKAVLNILLNQPDEAIKASEQALKLANDSYPSASLNLVHGLRMKKEYDQALEKARHISEHAETHENQNLANKQVRELEMLQNNPEPVPNSRELSDMFKEALGAFGQYARDELEVDDLNKAVVSVAKGALRRHDLADRHDSEEMIPFVEELLQDFSPYFTGRVIGEVGEMLPGRYPRLVGAAMHLACKSTGVIKKDSTRLMSVLVLLSYDGNIESVRHVFFKGLQVVSKQDPSRSDLVDLVEEDLGIIAPIILRAILHELPDEGSHSSYPIDVQNGETETDSPGCLPFIAIILMAGIITILYYTLFQ